GQRLDIGDDALPLRDRAHPLRRPLDLRRSYLAGPRRPHARHLLRRPDNHVSLGPERLIDETPLQPGDERRQEDDDPDSDGDARENQPRLPAPLTEVAQGNDQLESHVSAVTTTGTGPYSGAGLHVAGGGDDRFV